MTGTLSTKDTAAADLPAWAEELKRRYLRGEATQFVLHGNVHDLVLHGGKLLSLSEFLANVLLAPTREVIAQYNLSSGVRFAKKSPKAQLDNLDSLLLDKSADKVLPALEKLLTTQSRAAVVIDYAEMIVPVGDANFFGETDRQSVIALHRWSMSPLIEKSDNIVLLVTENLSELHPKIVANPRTATLKVPMPDAGERAAVIRLVNPQLDATWQERLAEVTAGLKTVQIKTLLEPPPEGADDPAERERYIRTLLGDAPAAAERAKKLSQMTAGMSRDEIKNLVNPAAAAPAAAPKDAEHDDILRLIYKRKREIIERECFGLIEFVTPAHDFSVVGGIDEVKRDLLGIAKSIREGRRARCPMGILFTGPMGTGKTFVAEAFVKETGLTAIKFKNFRSKWVGATEGNLEKILSVVQAIGQVIVIIDEGDRAFGNQEGEGDGGTSSRVIARIKEFMSDTENRGRVLFILMTNRPDKLDIDIKRAGRLDRKIPFLYPQEPADVEQVLAAQTRKHKLKPAFEFPRDRDVLSARLVGYSNADIEAVTLLAADYAQEQPVTPEHMQGAINDYLPSRDDEMLQYMELIAVFEASNRRMLPRKYAELPVEELQQRMNLLKLKVGGRR